MTQNTYYSPRLIIKNTECTSGMSGSISFPGNNQANTLKININDPGFQHARLFKEELIFYLNYGSDDSVPFFRGFIKNIAPTDTGVSITAIDGRSFINSKDSKMVELTDHENYDGFTLAAFLHDYINTNININNKTYIGLDGLRDTYPSISMSGVRSKPSPAYTLITNELKKAIDDSDVEKPLNYFIDMVEDGNKSNITFVKQKQLTTAPSLYLSFSDGILSYKYKRRAPANYATGGGSKFTYGSGPLGTIGMSVEGDFKDKNEARQELIKKVLLQYHESDEITLECTKGHDIGLGSIVRLNIEEEDIDDNHRVTSKNIKFGPQGVKFSLSLNKKPIILSDYIHAH